MLKVDLLIGGVIVAAVLLSVLGVATYERAPGAIEFDVLWSTSGDGTPSTSTSRSGPGAMTVTVPLEFANVSAMTWTLTISGAGPRAQPVTWTAEVEAPNGTVSEPQTGTLPQGAGTATGNPEFEFSIQPVPEDGSATAANESLARDGLGDDYNATAGQGEWVVRVQISGGQAPPLGLPGGEGYTLRVDGEATVFAASVTASVPDVESR